MTELQNKLLEMLSWLIKYLNENKLTYYVVGGTMLGAVRHQGFIPWDDDVDIAMPRPDYMKLINLLRNINDHYKLESPYENNPDYLYTYCKLYDINTTLIERQRVNVVRGIYIDIFPLDGVGNDLKESFDFFKKIDSKNMYLMTRTCAVRKQRKWYKNAAILLSRCNPFFNEKKYSLKIDNLGSKKPYDECLFIANISGAYREREIIEKRIFGNPTEYDFEGISVKGPECYNEYLTKIYKDWRKLPPVEKRGLQHDYISIDLQKPYIKP